MACPTVRLQYQIRSNCVDGRLEVRFQVFIEDVTPATEFFGNIHTGDIFFGNEITIPVNYPGPDPNAWQPGSAPNSLFQEYNHFYLEGVYNNVAFEFLGIMAECDVVHLADDQGTVRTDLDVPPCPTEPDPPCPDINWTEVPDPDPATETCNDAGLWDVTFEAEVASTEVGGELFWVDENNTETSVLNQSTSTVGDIRRLTGSHEFPPGSYKLRARTTCSSATVDVEFPACPAACPTITLSPGTFETFCVGETRRVTVTATVSMPPGQVEHLHARLLDDTGAVVDEADETANSVTLSVTDYYTGGPHEFVVELVSPQDCSFDDGSDRIEINVPACPPPPPETETRGNDVDCPDITIAQLSAVVEAGCFNDCPVQMTARIELPDGLDEVATIELGDEAGVFDSVTATAGDIESQFSRDYGAGAHTFRARVSLPSGCTYQAQIPFVVPSQTVRPPWWPEWAPTPPNWLCIAWFFLNVALMIATGVMIFITACWFQWWLLGVTIALAVVTAISVLLNILFCGWQGDMCPWMRWLPRILALMGLIFGVVVLVWAIIEAVVFSEVGTVPSWPCFLGAVIEFAYFEFLAFLAWEVLFFVGCNPVNFSDITNRSPQRNE